MMVRRSLLASVPALAFALVLVAALAAIGGGNAPTAAQGGLIIITDSGFSPNPVAIEAGSVVWANLGDVTHTATGESFDTGDIIPGSSTSITFDTLGTYHYSCSIHPEMTGTIVVVPGESPPPTAAPPGDEGCAQGYWKNHPASWGPTGFTPNQTVESVFDVPDAFGLDNVTLRAALGLGGGPGATGAAKLLLRAGVAGILNTAHPDVHYTSSVGDIIAAVDGTLASEDRGTMLSLATVIDNDNNLGCPLS
jgi:plastocyanin